MFYIVYERASGTEYKTLKVIEKEICPNGRMIERGITSDKQLVNTSSLLYQTPSFHIADDTTNIFLTERFYVRLNSENDYAILVNYADKYNAEIVRKGDLGNWYILKCSHHSPYNALELANIFYESGLFSAAEPEFINAIKRLCVNDTYFDYQWNLLNTEQYVTSYTGMDINFCDAHDITSGDESVIIAVVDGGIELAHPDLNLYSFSFDARTFSSPSQIYDSHGTACAGIIGAIGDNHLGVTGIAPDCPLMSISWNEYTPLCKIAEGINTARRNGASVINNSWQSSSSDYINDALDSALIYGREGKGCVVVCASGNTNMHYVRYPARYHSDIIAVGAITPEAKRKDDYDSYNYDVVWGSNYGDEIDVVAPGVFVPTTDRTGLVGYSNTSDTLDYYMRFYGTSAACAHVSAIAGLILSVNPDLTQQEVGYIIASSAQKVGTYNYTSTSGHPYGSWHEEMGYGLVDAYNSVLMAMNKYIQDTTYSTTPTFVESANDIYAGRNVTIFKPRGDVVIPSGSDVHYKARHAIRLKPGFRVEQGARFRAEIGNVSYPNNVSPRRSVSSVASKSATNISHPAPAINNTPNTPMITRKVIQNGQLYILHNNRVYNSNGILIR